MGRNGVEAEGRRAVPAEMFEVKVLTDGCGQGSEEVKQEAGEAQMAGDAEDQKKGSGVTGLAAQRLGGTALEERARRNGGIAVEGHGSGEVVDRWWRVAVDGRIGSGGMRWYRGRS